MEKESFEKSLDNEIKLQIRAMLRSPRDDHPVKHEKGSANSRRMHGWTIIETSTNGNMIFISYASSVYL